MKLKAEELDNEIISAFSQDESMYLIEFEKKAYEEIQFS
jgi:hypothetical protein